MLTSTVQKILRAGAVLLVWTCCLPGELFACRYNVRDVGFVDLEEPYHLYAIVHDRTPPDVVTLLQEQSSVAFRESNILMEVVNADHQKDHPAFHHLPPQAAEAAPVAVLVSPEGRSLQLSLSVPGHAFRETLATTLTQVLNSPQRDEIVKTAREAFGVVLLLEGDDPVRNGRAQQAIAGAVEQISQQMKLMPKAIARGPAQSVLPAALFEREKVLLWSLGLDTKPEREPRAAILYGKARWIGPLMKGEEISERNLAGVLSIIGADCECGLDMNWAQGTRLPVRWAETGHAALAKALGFDPESPMVKLEVGRILGKRGSSRTASLGYQEVSLDAQPGSRTDTGPGVQASTPTGKGSPGSGRSQPTPIQAESAPMGRASWFTLILSALVIVGTGVWIVVRSSRKQ